MTLNIGFLTSIGVNVGDDFIREGIRAILDRAGTRYRPFYVHKLDERSLTEPLEDEPYRVDDKYRASDIFIQAGAPVYWHVLGGRATSLTSAWHRWMWEERILDGSVDGPVFLNLGAGSGQPWGDDGSSFLADEACVDFARRAAARARITTVRDPLASRILDALALSHELLPCPAFLAAARHRLDRSDSGVIGVNLMPLGGHFLLDGEFDSATWLLRCLEIVNRLRTFAPLVFVAHDAQEAAFMAQFATGGDRVFESRSWRDYLDLYASCRMVVANRVHGAVCAAGFGTPAVILGNDSRAAIGDPIGLTKFRSGSEVESLFDAVESLLDNADAEAERLLALRDATLARYVELVRPIVDACGRKPRSTRRSTPAIAPKAALASVEELEAPEAGRFMTAVNQFAARFGMRQMHSWSKRWEYPWLWSNGLRAVPWNRVRVVDLGSELSPLPWLVAALGAEVVLVETNARYVPMWERWRERLHVDVDWRIVDSEALPFTDGWADVVTSFSVIEHQPDKAAAIGEAIRVLAPGGLLALSFDICEPSMGMTFPEWNGRALTLREFEQLVWCHPAFSLSGSPRWNVDDIPALLDWHTRTAPHHNYVVGAAVLQKATGERGGASWDSRVPRERTSPSALAVEDFSTSRVKALSSIRDALEAYRRKHGTYPRSNGWDGVHTAWGMATKDWIPGLVPEHLRELPRDPRMHEVPEEQYLYRSDGIDYKLISHNPEDYEPVIAVHPDMRDPVRSGWAYGFWSEGARDW